MLKAPVQHAPRGPWEAACAHLISQCCVVPSHQSLVRAPGKVSRPLDCNSQASLQSGERSGPPAVPFSPVQPCYNHVRLHDTSFTTTTQTLAWGCRDLYIQCTSKDFVGLAPVDVAQGGCILSCSQFEKCAGRELSKKWKERCGR